MLGEPDSILFSENGLEILIYEYVRFTPKARNFIPFNFFSLGSDVKKKTLVVLMNENDIVKKIALSESDTENKVGFFQ